MKLVPSLTIVTNDEVSDEILQIADMAGVIPSILPRVWSSLVESIAVSKSKWALNYSVQ